VTELQMGLMGLGAAAVVGVLAYNKWQERKHRKVAEQVMKSSHDDVLLGSGGAAAPRAETFRHEPALAGGTDDLEPRLEPMLGGHDDGFSADFEDRGAALRVNIEHDEPAFIPAVEAPVAPPPVPAKPPVAEAAPAPVAPAAPKPAPQPPVEAGEGEDLPPGDVPLALLDPRIDYIVVMELVDGVSAEQIARCQREAFRRITKPVNIIGFNERTREWEAVHNENPADYRRLRVALQLADRRGPASEADLTVFVAAVQQMADEFMAVADLPPHQSVLDRAVALDAFCANVDLEIGVNLVSRGNAFPGTKIRALAEAAGMGLGLDGLFTRFDDDGRPQFSLQNYENTPFTSESIKSVTTHGLTFLLDVPRVDHGDRVFFQMVELAKRFADTLQGTLVDDNRQPLGDAQLDHIKREFIMKPQVVMANQGLPAGSAQSLRLFS